MLVHGDFPAMASTWSPAGFCSINKLMFIEMRQDVKMTFGQTVSSHHHPVLLAAVPSRRASRQRGEGISSLISSSEENGAE